MYTVRAFQVTRDVLLFALDGVISENVLTNCAVISGPALEVVAELGHRAFLPCSLSSPQVFLKSPFLFDMVLFSLFTTLYPFFEFVLSLTVFFRPSFHPSLQRLSVSKTESEDNFR